MNLKLLLETMILVVMTLVEEVKITVVLFKNTLLLTQSLIVKGLLHTPVAAQREQIKDLLVTLSKIKDVKKNHHDVNLPRQTVWSRDHRWELIDGDPQAGVQTRSATRNECFFSGFLSQVKPKKIEEALIDPDWVIAMQDELNQFERQKVWKLVPRPKDKTVIGTRWVFRNKLDEDGIVTRNKARLGS